ncbi:hypothetical protein O4215_21560 [Rhodococcus maanshanensis]|uniref:hypothetical protein n=1 Tax=Rhodococcus maanshanensis TaxID=183556 RepID=UPI0022B56F95|nr:hypothetical protein [Rhodococcus maanshanensis]MCZ4558152.1 hypothetical protein [Rhodococcus maanshanensis]
MSEVQDSGWGAMGSAIDGGHLYLEPDVARRCAQRCSEFVAQLDEIKRGARALGKMDGFGDHLQSAVTLATKFEKKAVGGDYSLEQAIGDYIVEVQKMQQTFEKIAAMYAASDEAGAQGISSSGAGL